MGLKTYEESVDGVIESFVDRLPVGDALDVTKLVQQVWERDLVHFPLPGQA